MHGGSTAYLLKVLGVAALSLSGIGTQPTLADARSSQSPTAEQALPATQPTAAAQPPECAKSGEKDKPLPRPKYEINRADDDFAYLDGPPGSYQPDFFDPIKRIHLGDDLTLRLGGETRGRLESVTHRRFGSDEGRRPGQFPTQDTYFLHRYYYHADVAYGKAARFYVEGLDAWVEDRDLTAISNPENRFDAHQMFTDLRVLGPDTPLTLRVGRQELSYGNERLVGVSDWSNVRRTWDAVKLFWPGEKFRIDAFYARLVEIRNRRPDWSDEDIKLYGLYGTYKFKPDHGVDTYFFALRNDGQYTNANYTTGDIGDLSNYTMGTRFWGSRPLGSGVIDYENELAGQWGKASGDTIQAWMWSLYGGYTASKVPATPRLGFGLDYATGDTDPYDDIHQTWNPLFSTGHRYLGYLDIIGRQNLWCPNVNFTLKPTEKVTVQAFWYNYWLDHTRDALYNKSQQPIRRFPKGGVGSYVGNELDLAVTWQLDVHASLLFGYSHLWPSGQFFNRRNQPGDAPDLLYLQYRYLF